MPITTQPSAGKPAGASGDFQNGLFGCACGSCIKALFCPCLIAKDVANEVGDSGTLWCLGYLAGIFTGYLPMYLCVCYQRGVLRQNRGIDGGCCSDFILSYLCACCVLTQMDREVNEN